MAGLPGKSRRSSPWNAAIEAIPRTAFVAYNNGGFHGDMYWPSESSNA